MAIYLLLAGPSDYGREPVSLIISAHLLAALLAGVSIHIHSIERQWSSLLAFVLVLTLPVIGYIATWQLIKARASLKYSDLFIQYGKHISSGSGGDSSTAPGKKKSLAYLKERFNIGSLSSTLDKADTDRKLRMIRSLGKLPGAHAVKMLKKLLEDGHMDVRYYAGEELAKVGELYGTLIHEMKKSIARHPEDPGLYCELGSLHMRNALSGIFEDNREELENAKRALLKSLELKEDHPGARELLGRLYIHIGEWDRAIETLEPAMKMSEVTMSAMIALAECYWMKRDFRLLRSLIEKAKAASGDYEGEDKSNILQFIESWESV